ncbi:hypothetical protein HOE67_05375 [Candidatus Peregrinibacteria bacterium]|jgi:hypothetical protein|nr:hypothetical protein [Candidatus Peregrinibacteria bacterium]MBT4056514.1 hypothetical protein [Candidatus Peregrinibacteria bacterium]
MNKKPLKMAHAGRVHCAGFRENSPEAVCDSLTAGADIIEIDVRKSRDGVLYCYHGFPWWRFVGAWGLRFFSFATIRKMTQASKLVEVADVVRGELGGSGGSAILFLDIKDKRVRGAELMKICDGFGEALWIAPCNFRYLKKLKREVGEGPTYVYNFYFLFVRWGMRRLVRAGIGVFKVLPWQLSAGVREEASKLGLRYACDWDREGNVWEML